MKWSLVLLSLLLVACTREVATPPLIRAQSSGCELTGWIMQQKPHSTRTLEAPPSVLRDTVITVNGTEHKISIPEGFTMSVFAQIPSCRGLALSSDGVIYATSFNGKIYALPDHDHNGTPDSVIIVATGLGQPHGIGFIDKMLYASSDQGALYHLITPATSRVSTDRSVVSPLPPHGDHFTRNFVFDSIHQKIYLQIGSDGNIDTTTNFVHLAQIVEMNPDGSGYRTFARGLRNAVGLDLDPRTDALWANNNGMDDIFGSGTELTANNPSESIYIICDGANYGWPFCYGFRMRNPVYPWSTLDTNIVQTFSGPVAEVLAHEAPLGLHFYRGSTFPALYHNAIFQCYHGSWDRSPPAPPRITVMWADTDGKNARVTDFVNGFQPDSTDNRWGRVVSIIEGGDSALYVSDDQAGVIYRIAWTGPPQQQAVNSTQNSVTFSLGIPSPNPATNAVAFTIDVAQPASISVYLLDLLGRQLRSIPTQIAGVGTTTFHLPTDGLPNGTYVLRASSNGQVASRRVVIER